MSKQTFKTTYISTNTDTVVKAAPGILHSITIGETAAGAITIYDNTSAASTVILVLKASIAEQTFVFDITFNVGLTITTAGSSKLQVSWE
jgi:hypothetical protein